MNTRSVGAANADFSKFEAFEAIVGTVMSERKRLELTRLQEWIIMGGKFLSVMIV
jgi:hypothetical protein